MPDKTFIQVLVPLKLDWIPWYSTTDSLSIGDRVLVRVGPRRYTGVVWTVGLTPTIPESKIIPISGIAEGLDPISAEEMELWRFIADYYICTLGEVYRAAYSNPKTKSEQQAAAAMQRSEASREKMCASIRARIERLEADLAAKDAAIKEISPKAIKAREAALKVRANIQEKLSAARQSLQSFQKVEAPKLDFYGTTHTSHKPGTTLLWAEDRAGSYIKAIRRTLDEGHNALVLVPETDFSDNLQTVLEEEFGSELRLHNMRQSATRKRRIAESLRNPDSPEVVLGTRSALFLPWKNLGLVIIDEEQDASYKQQDPAPRYNARDLATKLAAIHGADVILGTACPSLESLYNARSGKYALEHTQQADVPTEIIDISAERRKNGVLGYFTRKMVEQISASTGMVTLIRGWEDEAQLAHEFSSLYPDRDFQILSAHAARKAVFRSGITCVMQADSLSSRDDFRADEKALQLLSALRAKTDCFVVQTAKGEHPLYQALQQSNPEYLLEERRLFSLPPYARLIDLHSTTDGSLIDRISIPRGPESKKRRSELLQHLSPNVFADVDPL